MTRRIAGPPPLRPWEARALDAVGATIEFWGFKANHGRVWGLLYLRGQAMSAAQLQRTLKLSKGAVSMVTNECERWRVIRRVRQTGSSVWLFEAETDFTQMIARVLADRELAFVSRVQHDLVDIEREARADDQVSAAELKRLRDFKTIADRMHQALQLLLSTWRLDLKQLGGVLRESGQRLLNAALTRHGDPS